MTKWATWLHGCVLSGFIAASVFVAQSGASEGQSDGPPFRVAAWVSTAGPYGPLWDLTLTAEGGATLQVLYPSNPSGELNGRFQLAADVLTDLRNTIDRERFFDLPPTLSSKAIPFHAPDLRLDIQVGTKHHKVTLYNPKQISEEATTQRFLRVWSKVFAGLPLKPTW